MLPIGTGSLAPSRTNTGSTSCRASSVVSATSRRIAGVRRSRRGRWAGNAIMVALRRAEGRRSDGFVTG